MELEWSWGSWSRVGVEFERSWKKWGRGIRGGGETCVGGDLLATSIRVRPKPRKGPPTPPPQTNPPPAALASPLPVPKLQPLQTSLLATPQTGRPNCNPCKVARLLPWQACQACNPARHKAAALARWQSATWYSFGSLIKAEGFWGCHFLGMCNFHRVFRACVLKICVLPRSLGERFPRTLLP